MRQFVGIQLCDVTNDCTIHKVRYCTMAIIAIIRIMHDHNHHNYYYGYYFDCAPLSHNSIACLWLYSGLLMATLSDATFYNYHLRPFQGTIIPICIHSEKQGYQNSTNGDTIATNSTLFHRGT